MKNIILIIVLILTALSGCASSKRNAVRDGDILGARAHGFFMAGDILRAIDVYKNSFTVARRGDNVYGAAQSLSNIGRAYFEINKLDSAAIYFAMAHEEFTIIAKPQEASRVAAWTALTFASMNDGAQANRWFNMATSANTRPSKSNAHFFALMRARIDFLLTSNITNESELNAAYNFYAKEKNDGAQITILILRADIELSRGNCAAATRHLEDVLRIIESSQEKYKRSTALLNLAKINFCTGDQTRARHFFARAQDTAPRGATLPTIDEVEVCGRVCR